MSISLFFFFFNDTATTEIYTLSLHDALPIYDNETIGLDEHTGLILDFERGLCEVNGVSSVSVVRECRSEEHTSELQSQSNLVCRLLLEKKKKKTNKRISNHYQNNYTIHNNKT